MASSLTACMQTRQLRSALLPSRSRFSTRQRLAAMRGDGGEGSKVPKVDPSFVIPPPARGSQYSPNLSGGGGWAGGGGNRGGAHNLFTGGFFGPGGGRSSLFGRLRLLIMFWIYCTFLGMFAKSVVQLTVKAASCFSHASWRMDSEEAPAGVVQQSQASSSASVVEAVAADDPSLHGSDISAPTSASMEAGEVGSRVEAEGVEVRGVGDDERAYLEMLRKHHEAQQNPQAEAEMSWWSLGLYFMVLGSVSFFAFIK